VVVVFAKLTCRKLDALCSDISAHLDAAPVNVRSRSGADEVSYRSASESRDCWPTEMGKPGAVGAQNDLRYAFFPDSRRLVIDDQGMISVYDTGNHLIFRHGEGPEQRSNALVHQPKQLSQSCRTAESCRLSQCEARRRDAYSPSLVSGAKCRCGSTLALCPSEATARPADPELRAEMVIA
jgi:hypothetical protein